MVNPLLYDYDKPLSAEKLCEMIRRDRINYFNRKATGPNFFVTKNVFDCLVNLGFIDKHGNNKLKGIN